MELREYLDGDIMEYLLHISDILILNKTSMTAMELMVSSVKEHFPRLYKNFLAHYGFTEEDF